MTEFEIFQVGAIIFTWVAGIFAFGKIYGVLMSEVKQTKERVSKVEAQFYDAAGEPRLLTYVAHDQIATACQRHVFSQINDGKTRMDKHDEKLDKILDGISELKSAIALRNGIDHKRSNP